MVLGSLDEALTCCSLLACWKAWQTHLFMKVHVRCIHLFRMYHSFIRWWTYPSACAPFIHPIRHLAMFVGVSLPAVTYDKTTSNQKPPSLPWHIIILDASDQERQQGCEVRWWLWELMMRTVQESLSNEMGNLSQQWLFARSGLTRRKNCTNFGRDSLGYRKERQGWFAHFLEWMDSGSWIARFAQFYKGTSQAAWRVSRTKLCSLWEELHGRLTTKTTQFREGIGS